MEDQEKEVQEKEEPDLIDAVDLIDDPPFDYPDLHKET